jgi:hypothetical protein
MVASCHDGIVRVWDTRKGTLASLNAHRTTIDELQWSSTQRHQFLTCSSNDNKLKFWSSAGHECQYHLQTNRPVQAALYTPHHSGLVTVSDTNLRQWRVGAALGREGSSEREENIVPVRRFHAPQQHQQVSIDWRCMDSRHDASGNGKYQLLSLDTAANLHAWNVKFANNNPNVRDEDEDGNDKLDGDNEGDERWDPELGEEIDDIGELIPCMRVVRTNPTRRSCDVHYYRVPDDVEPLALKVTFPDTYPFNIAPLFIFTKQARLRLPANLEASIMGELAQVRRLFLRASFQLYF